VRGKINIHQTLATIIEELKGGSKLVFIHQNADVDAIGSSIAVSIAFPDCTICTYQSVSAQSKIFLEELGFEVLIDPDPEVIENFEKYLVLDTSSPSQLGGLVEHIEAPIVIDHHTRTDNWDELSKIYYCDESKKSCAEIIYELLVEAGIELDKTTGFALLAGIITDTGRFKFANNETLSTFSEIMARSGIELDQILNLVDTDNNFDHSQKIAHLKSAQRLKFESLKGVIIANSVVGAFESSSCKNLLMLGADVAFVGSQQGNEVRINGKAKPFLLDQGLHLGKIMDAVGKDCECEGGGHPGVGGLNGDGDVEAVLNICVGKVKDWLMQR
jgi:nanoRNase/pAp phosphatase (c-di-AMP/oligoRNAs hydrolase)